MVGQYNSGLDKRLKRCVAVMICVVEACVDRRVRVSLAGVECGWMTSLGFAAIWGSRQADAMGTYGGERAEPGGSKLAAVRGGAVPWRQQCTPYQVALVIVTITQVPLRNHLPKAVGDKGHGATIVCM